MIPKKIHYVWLGHGEMNERAKLCLKSWKEKLPDYEVIEWNEDNLPMDELGDFFTQAYENKKWAFASDVARLWVLYTQGGIYLDTDVEVYQNFDEFLSLDGFIGFESHHYLSTATIGACQYNPIIKLILDYYMSIDFKFYDIWTDYIKYEETSPCIYTNLIALLGLNRDSNESQSIKHFNIYPKEYFFTQGQYFCYHSFNGSW